MPTLAVNKITCQLVACLIHAAGAMPSAAAQTSISNAGNCTIVLERSSARDVKVTGCNQNSVLERSLESKINAIIANQAIEIDRIDEIILSLNDFFKISESSQKTILEVSYITDDKVDKIINILDSFQEKPEDAAGLIPLLSDGNLSHIQKKKPFGIQIVNVIRVDRKSSLDLVLRVVESGPKSYQIGVLTSSNSNRLKHWSVIGNLGTACSVWFKDEAFEIGRSLSTTALAASVKEYRSFSREFPRTIVLTARCSSYAENDDLTLRTTFFTKLEDDTTSEWEPVDFRFDVSKQTQMVTQQQPATQPKTR
jgi:hypothetical protein